MDTGGRGALGERDEASPDPNGPSLFSAIRDQLGLRLESQNAPVDLIVLDHVSHTLTAN